jgi:Type II secretion system (T2SS), protein E, N-terminal domain
MSSTEPANMFPEPAQPAPTPAPTQETAQPSMRDVPLGTLIFRAGLLGEEQLEDALQEGMRTGKRLGEVLLERGWLNERDLGRMLAGQKGLPFVDVAVSDVEPDALLALNQDDARRQVALPLFYEDGELVIAVGDPSNELVLESLRREIETEFQLVVAPHGQLQQVIDEAYAHPAPEPEPEPAPAPFEGVLFPELLPRIQAESRAEPDPEPESVHEFTPAVELELEPDPEAAPEIEAETEMELEPELEADAQAVSGSTPTLLSRMLFPSVRHAAQDTEAQVDVAEEPEAKEPAPEEPEAEAPAAEEDFDELEVPTLPEMPVPSFEQKAAEPEPTEAEPPSEPAAEAEPVPSEPAQAEAAPSEPAAEAEPEPEADSEPEPEAKASKYSVLVRLRDGETLPIGEFATADEASALARDAVGQISSAAGEGTWPLFAGRYLSPDTIVSVDLLEESPDA